MLISSTCKGFDYIFQMPMVQSMVPEVSLFFGNEDSTFVPSVQHPASRLGGPLRPSSQYQPMASSTPMQPSGPPGAPVPNISNVSAQNRSVPSSVNNYLSNAASLSSQSATTARSPQHLYGNGAGPAASSQQNRPSPGSQYNGPMPTSQLSSVSPTQNAQLHSVTTTATAHTPGQPGYYGAPGVPTGPPGSVRPPYCNCPSCPKPYPPQYYRSQSYEPMRGQNKTYPRHPYPHYGPPPPRLNSPQFSGYPPQHHQPGMFQQHGIVSHSYPPPSNEYPHSSYPAVQQGAPTVSEMNTVQNSQSGPTNLVQGAPAPRSLPPVPSSEQNSVPTSYMVHAANLQQDVSQPRSRFMVPVPQASGGMPARAEERFVSQGQVQNSGSIPVNGSGDVRRSNQSSDNSGRASDDSGLSFTPEKPHSPANPSPKAQPQNANSPTGDLKSSIPTINWENVPPEIYQLLMAQNEQLKQLQAQIEVLTAQSLNNTVESAVPMKSQTSPEVQKCSAATNTSAAYGGKEQVSACMQTSQQELQPENPLPVLPQPHVHRDMSSSSGSGCETKTPLEIRHRGRLPMNSTQREDADLDISQGELVALINNMHDKTIDSVQSEMIVDLPSFQSSPTRYM